MSSLNGESEKCDKCIYIRYTWNKGGMPTIPICHAVLLSENDMHERCMNNDTDDYCKLGHELYPDRKRLSSLPASQLYKYDPVIYSETPTGFCGSWDDNCRDGEGKPGVDKLCYSRWGCTSCMDVNNHSKRSILCKANRDFIQVMAYHGFHVE